MLHRLILKVAKFQLLPPKRLDTMVKNTLGGHHAPPPMSNRVKKNYSEDKKNGKYFPLCHTNNYEGWPQFSYASHSNRTALPSSFPPVAPVWEDHVNFLCPRKLRSLNTILTEIVTIFAEDAVFASLHVLDWPKLCTDLLFLNQGASKPLEILQKDKPARGV